MRIKDHTDMVRHLTDSFNIPEARRMIQQNPALTQEQFKAGGIVEPGVRLGFDKGGTAEVIKYLNTLPDNTEITKKMVTDYVTKNKLKLDVQTFITRNIVNRSPRITSKVVYKTKVMPIEVTDNLLKKIDYYVKETDLSLKQISKKIGRRLERSVDRTRDSGNLFQKYEDKYGTAPKERFGYRGLKLTEDSPKVQKIFELFDQGLSKKAIATKLGYDRQDVRKVFHSFRPEDIKKANVPGPETGAKIRTKKRRGRVQAGTKLLSGPEKLFNKKQEDLVRQLNDDFKKNPNKVLNNKKLTGLLNLKLEDGNIVSKNKTKEELLKSINREGGLLDVEHISDVATEKKNIQFPVNRQITTYNVNSGFLKSVAGYVNRPDADPKKVKKIIETLEKYGLRVDTGKGTIGAKMIGASDNITRNLSSMGLETPKPLIIDTQIKNLLKNAEIPCIKGAGGQCDTAADYRKGFNELVQRGAAGDEAAVNKLQKFTKAMKKIKGAAKWTGYGLLAEIGFMVPFAAADYASGESWKRIIGNATDWGFGPMFGQSEDEEIISYLPEGSLGAETKIAEAASERVQALADPQKTFPKARIGMDPKRFQEAQTKMMEGAVSDLDISLAPFMVHAKPGEKEFSEDLALQSMEEWKAAQEQIQLEKLKRTAEREERGIIEPPDWYMGVDARGYRDGGIGSLLKK